MLTTNVIEPKIIDDLEAGPFNTPEVDEEEFQMIDLDTGLPLDEDYDSGLSEDEFDIIVDLDFDKEESEEEALSKALDAAFSNLTGETLDSRLSDEEFAMGGEIEEKTQELDELTQSMIGKAQDLDLDLSFLNDGISKEDSDV